MVWCDKNENVLEWGSRDYYPVRVTHDNRIHRYFPDFYIKGKTSSGTTKYIVEVKPKAQTLPPKKGRKTKKLNEIATYGVNQAKWKAARVLCRS